MWYYTEFAYFRSQRIDACARKNRISVELDSGTRERYNNDTRTKHVRSCNRSQTPGNAIQLTVENFGTFAPFPN